MKNYNKEAAKIIQLATRPGLEFRVLGRKFSNLYIGENFAGILSQWADGYEAVTQFHAARPEIVDGRGFYDEFHYNEMRHYTGPIYQRALDTFTALRTKADALYAQADDKLTQYRHEQAHVAIDFHFRSLATYAWQLVKLTPEGLRTSENLGFNPVAFGFNSAPLPEQSPEKPKFVRPPKLPRSPEPGKASG